MRLLASALVLFGVAANAFAADRVTASGIVNDASGKPVDHATVLVYSAGVRTGYSTYCPTCYVDCGKRAATDTDGKFTIPGLAGDLVFDLLVMKDGFAPTWIKKVDPEKGAAEPAAMKTRDAIEDATRVVRGRVVDAKGDPVRDAIVEQEGVTYPRPDGNVVTQFGPSGWTDMLAVTNGKGEFEIAYGVPAQKMIFRVSPRGMAPKLFTAATGADRKSFTVTDGATIRGRLVKDGKPVSNAELGLAVITHRAGATYPEIRIGTGPDGQFAITNVPPGRVWTLYAKMDSLAGRGAVDTVLAATKDDGQEVDLGDIQVKPALKFSGRVVLSDGKPIPDDMRVIFGSDTAGSQTKTLASDGSFEFGGLVYGAYQLSPAVKGYRVPDGVYPEILVDRDITGYVIRLEPAPLAPVRR